MANAVAAFEPVTMVVQSAADAAEAGAALSGDVEIVELPIDDSWLRDSGPIFVCGPGGAARACTSASTRGARSSRPTTATPRSAACSSTASATAATTAPFVLEGGSICVDGAGTLLTTEQCLLHPSRNPGLSREEIEQGLRDYLGVETRRLAGQGAWSRIATPTGTST